MQKPDMAVHIRTHDGGTVEVMTSTLDGLVQQYIDEHNLDEDAIKKHTTWLGILQFIYMQVFKPMRNMQYNAQSILAESPKELEKVWDWYVITSYRFGKTPTILQFCSLVGLDRHTIQDWNDGSTRNLSKEYSTLARKMKQQSEGALESKVYETNSIGGIFGLKSSHGWRETSPVPAEAGEMLTHDTPEQIMQRHRGAVLPSPLNLDD